MWYSTQIFILYLLIWPLIFSLFSKYSFDFYLEEVYKCSYLGFLICMSKASGFVQRFNITSLVSWYMLLVPLLCWFVSFMKKVHLVFPLVLMGGVDLGLGIYSRPNCLENVFQSEKWKENYFFLKLKQCFIELFTLATLFHLNLLIKGLTHPFTLVHRVNCFNWCNV